MMKRVILLVVEGLGVGAAEDASEYGDVTMHTLAHLAESAGGLSVPTLESLGLGHVSAIRGVRSMAQPVGCFGRLGFRSKGVDSLVGYWEIAGCLTEDDGRLFSDGYSPDAKAALKQVFGHDFLGGQVASAEEALREFGASHISAGTPFVWTDGRQTCHVAAHEQVWSADLLYQRSREARKALKDTWGIRRVVAHPVLGSPGALQFGPGRRDFAGEPPGQTMLDVLNRASQILIGVGKVGDLFGGRGLTRSVVAPQWTDAVGEIGGMFNRVPRGLIVAGLDVIGSDAGKSAAAIEEFDRRLPELLDQLRPGDLFLVTGDHGRDPKKPHALPTREYVPILITGPKLAQGVNLGVRPTAADVGQTVVEALKGDSLTVGESFLDVLRPG
ncbi:MAG TPA: phosphopentomutase [Nitrospira sp.]|nr:phosphopentomutase [Nitrospira sp.]